MIIAIFGSVKPIRPSKAVFLFMVVIGIKIDEAVA